MPIVRMQIVQRPITFPVELAVQGLVEVPVKENAQIIWNPGHNQKLYKYVVTEGRPFFIVGRNSASSGSSGYRAAALDAHQAADALLMASGMDVRPLLPTVEELAELIRTRSFAQVHTTPEGDQFINRFVLVHLEGSGIVLSLSTGTGSKVSDNLEQPHVVMLERYMRGITPMPAGIWAKRTDRYCRTKHGHTDLYDRLELMDSRAGVWAGDGYAGQWEFDKESTTMVLQSMATYGAVEAKIMRQKTRSSQLPQTGDRMVGGRVVIATCHGAPPGTMRYRDPFSGRLNLAIDTPSNYPEGDAIIGLPRVLGPDGELADQERMVKEFLSQYGREDVDPTLLFVELAQQGLSSHWLRSKRGDRTISYREVLNEGTLKPGQIAKNWINYFRKNLGFYESGILTVRVSGESKDIHDCFPADGMWATEEDFARIHEAEATRISKVGRKATSAWSSSGWKGVEVEVAGESTRMKGRDRTSGSGTWRGPGVDWLIDSPERAFKATVPFVPQEALNGSVVDALRAADDTLLDRYSMSAISEAANAAHERLVEIARRESEIAATRKSKFTRFMGLGEVSEEMAAEFRRFDADMAAEAAALETERRKLSIDLTVSRQQIGATSSDLSKIVAFLRGRVEPGIQGAMGRAVRNLKFELLATAEGVATRGRRSGNKGPVPVSWSGELVLDDERKERNLWRIPFAGRYDLEEDLAGIRPVRFLGLLRKGEVMRNLAGPLAQARDELAELVGAQVKQLRPVGCNEPELVRLWAALQFPDPISGEAPGAVTSVQDLLSDPSITDVFGGVECTRKLVNRMSPMAWDGYGGGWMRAVSEEVTAAVIRNAEVLDGRRVRARTASAADTNDARELRAAIKRSGQLHRWVFERLEWARLIPCAFCGGSWCVPMKIREVAGYLCLAPDCRRDENGVVWPLRYDRYVSELAPLKEAGAPLSVCEVTAPSSKKFSNQSARAVSLFGGTRPLEDLDESELADLVDSYLRGENSMRLFERLKITKTAAYAYLDAQDIPRHIPGGNRKRGARFTEAMRPADDLTDGDA